MALVVEKTLPVKHSRFTVHPSSSTSAQNHLTSEDKKLTSTLTLSLISRILNKCSNGFP